MPILTLIAVVIVVGYAVFYRLDAQSPSKIQPTPQISQNTQDVAGDTTSPLPQTSSPPSTSLEQKSVGGADIDIKVDTNIPDKQTSIRLIYPGAVHVKSEGNSNYYETGDGGDSVYDWYKTEMEKREFNIRNNVKTRANDKFKAVIQGVSATESLKVTIDQENSSAKTTITLE